MNNSNITLSARTLRAKGHYRVKPLARQRSRIRVDRVIRHPDVLDQTEISKADGSDRFQGGSFSAVVPRSL